MEQGNFPNEKALQTLIEANLETVFNCRIVASEFRAGPQHGDRIDTLALSEDSHPVIIQYRKADSSELINRSLFYLDWVKNHRNDFEIAAQEALGPGVDVDWSEVRVICVAPNYKKYDLHAAQVMGAKMELWTYRLFKNQTLYLEEVLQKSYSPSTDATPAAQDPKMDTGGEKVAVAPATGSHTFDEHVNEKSPKIKELAYTVREFIMGLDPRIEEAPKEFYIAYKISQNFVCMEFQKQRIILYLKLNPKEVNAQPNISRDVSDSEHYGTGDLEISLLSSEDFESVKDLIELAYQKVGG